MGATGVENLKNPFPVFLFSVPLNINIKMPGFTLNRHRTSVLLLESFGYHTVDQQLPSIQRGHRARVRVPRDDGAGARVLFGVAGGDGVEARGRLE